MNWMDDGTNQSEFQSSMLDFVNVKHNINIAEAIKLSAEKAGYEADIRKNGEDTEIIIKTLFCNRFDVDIVVTFRGIEYHVRSLLLIDKPNTMEEKFQILEYLNNKKSWVRFHYLELNGRAFVFAGIVCRRLDKADRHLEYGRINIELFNAQHEADYDLLMEQFKLLEKSTKYLEEDLEFNLSGEWNASLGYEYNHVINDINSLIMSIQEELENNRLNYLE